MDQDDGITGEPAGLGRPAASLPEALAVTAASALIPGLAHVRAGRTRTGVAMITCFGLTAAAGAVVVTRYRGTLLEAAVRPGWLAVCMGVAGGAAFAWAVLVGRSYLLVRPPALSPLGATSGAVAVAALCLLAALPPLAVARYAYTQRDLINNLFAAAPLPAAPPVAPGDRGRTAPAGRWVLPRRLNILLLGGDADVGRPGVRTDSMTLASVDTTTGDTVLLSLPRNLQHVPVWSGRGRVPFPRAELLNEVYEYGIAHPKALNGRVHNAGAELLKRTVGHILGLPVDYYGMVDMRSFRQIVDAMGGVRVCAHGKVPVPRQQVPAGVLRPGCRKLTGREALWFGRSRTGSSDFVRMGRQKCLLWAIARQASPFTVLRSFQRLAHIFKYSVNTDIPRGLLPRLIDLSDEVRQARISSLQFIPPLISTGRPDYAKIRMLAHRAISDSTRNRNLPTLGTTCT